ncbi:hypothetical protein FH972_025050 [Carpinus fangiana]|uniref:Major facilitator superfamily (MFS) profile domain-containing protein n=1 Tax=Carpinus fangiana TaxID=176857 RepID=A0A5N6L022_9ROSI|nr:hypothetical protein FH972_025050 [Carpinus fangiana]
MPIAPRKLRTVAGTVASLGGVAYVTVEAYCRYALRFGRTVEEQVRQSQRRQAATRGQDGPPDGIEEKSRQENQNLASAEPVVSDTDVEKAESGQDWTSPANDGIRRPSNADSVEEETEPTQPQTTDRRTPSRSTSLSQVSTRNSLRQVGTRLGQSLSGINVRHRQTNEGGDKDAKVFVVDFHGPDDPLNPHNWSRTARWFATANIASIAFIVGFASSVDSGILREAAEEFGVSEVVESLATGLFLIGFGVGGLTSGPLSETLGRNPVYIATLALYMVFIMASALAPNIGAQLAFRFIAGYFGSTPLTCAGGSLADMWDPMERVYTFPLFANAGFSGPVVGPLASGWIAQKLYWRWTEWVTLIASGVILVLLIFTQPETFSGVILSWKAAHLRRITGDERYVAPLEVSAETLTHRIGAALYRPFVMTAQEPIIILITLYLTVVYIILFTFLDGYDYIFAEIHGTSQGITGTCFAGIVVGLFLASTLVPLVYSWAKRDLAKIKEQGGDKLPPEFRLWFCMLGGSAAIPISLFWMGWTSYPSVSIWSPLVASVFFGYGILTVFISVGASAGHVGAVCRSRCDDRGWDTLLPQPRGTLDSDDFGCDQRINGSCAIPLLHLRRKLQPSSSFVIMARIRTLRCTNGRLGRGRAGEKEPGGWRGAERTGKLSRMQAHRFNDNGAGSPARQRRGGRRDLGGAAAWQSSRIACPHRPPVAWHRGWGGAMRPLIAAPDQAFRSRRGAAEWRRASARCAPTVTPNCPMPPFLSAALLPCHTGLARPWGAMDAD